MFRTSLWDQNWCLYVELKMVQITKCYPFPMPGVISIFWGTLIRFHSYYCSRGLNWDENSVQGPDSITSAGQCLAWCQTQSGWDACDWISPECYTHVGVNIRSNNPGWYPEDDLIEGKCWLKRKCTSDMFLIKEVKVDPTLSWVYPHMQELAPILNGDFKL